MEYSVKQGSDLFPDSDFDNLSPISQFLLVGDEIVKLIPDHVLGRQLLNVFVDLTVGISKKQFVEEIRREIREHAAETADVICGLLPC